MSGERWLSALRGTPSGGGATPTSRAVWLAAGLWLALGLTSCNRDEPQPATSPASPSSATEQFVGSTAAPAADRGVPAEKTKAAAGADRARLERAWLKGRCALVGAGKLTDTPFAEEGFATAAELLAAFEVEAARDPGWAKALIRRAETENCAVKDGASPAPTDAAPAGEGAPGATP